MSIVQEIHAALERLASVLSPYDKRTANYVRKCKASTAQEVADDLDLWGGMGSIMDEGVAGKDRSIQRQFEAAAIELANALQREGANSKYMNKWKDVFKQWQSVGI